MLDGAWTYSATPEKSALSDRLTQHLGWLGNFSRLRLEAPFRCGGVEVLVLAPCTPKYPPAPLHPGRLLGGQHPAPDTAAAGLLGSAPLYLRRISQAAVVPPARRERYGALGFLWLSWRKWCVQHCSRAARYYSPLSPSNRDSDPAKG